MIDWFHRMVTGQAVTRKELVIGGIFVAIWFAMDVIQFVDWLMGKLR